MPNTEQDDVVRPQTPGESAERMEEIHVGAAPKKDGAEHLGTAVDGHDAPRTTEKLPKFPIITADGRTITHDDCKGPYPIVLDELGVDMTVTHQTMPESIEDRTAWAVQIVRAMETGMYTKCGAEDVADGKVAQLLELRQKGPKEPVLNVKRGQNCDALYMQLVGTDAEDECNRCRTLSGKFVGCRTHPVMGKGACANCHYGSDGTKCSKHVDFKEDKSDVTEVPTPAKKAGRKVPVRRSTVRSARKPKGTVKDDPEPESDGGARRRHQVFVDRKIKQTLRGMKAETWLAIGAVCTAIGLGELEIVEESTTPNNSEEEVDWISEEEPPSAKRKRSG